MSPERATQGFVAEVVAPFQGFWWFYVPFSQGGASPAYRQAGYALG